MKKRHECYVKKLNVDRMDLFQCFVLSYQDRSISPTIYNWCTFYIASFGIDNR